MTFQDFLNNIFTDKPLSPNRFQMTITGSIANTFGTTTGISGNSTITNNAKAIMLSCQSVTIPGLNLNICQDKRVGLSPVQSFPDGKEFIPFAATFIESESHKERRFFTTWHQSIYNPTTNRIAFFDNISATVQIDQLDRSNNII